MASHKEDYRFNRFHFAKPLNKQTAATTNKKKRETIISPIGGWDFQSYHIIIFKASSSQYKVMRSTKKQKNIVLTYEKSGSFETLADLKLLYIAKNKLEPLIPLSLSPDAFRMIISSPFTDFVPTMNVSLIPL